MTATQPPLDPTAAAPAPQIVYVQVPAPAPSAITPIQQAQLENQQAWRNFVIVSVILLITVLLAWAIPLILIAVLVGNGNRMAAAQREMAAGVTVYTPPEPRDDGPAARWVLAAVALLIGLLVLVGGFAQGSGTTIIPGLLLLVGAAALAPWRPWKSD